ncbi:MAG: hypothetical protein H7276_08935 [Caulobacter sp.]|nr:hypothetical protein [Vitreoscilla sp.]
MHAVEQIPAGIAAAAESVARLVVRERSVDLAWVRRADEEILLHRQSLVAVLQVASAVVAPAVAQRQDPDPGPRRRADRVGLHEAEFGERAAGWWAANRPRATAWRRRASGVICMSRSGPIGQSFIVP